MARIFYGRRDMLDSAVLEAVRTLSDEFWVLAEFDLDRRNIDWLIIRAVPEHRPKGFFSALYMTELKHTSAQLSGGESGPWTVERNGIAKVIVPNNKADENYWHQTTNVSETVRRWLHNNQRRFLSIEQPEQTEASIKVWPTLLILSDPPEMVHRLPLAPANRFGAFHHDLAKWLDSVQHWHLKQGFQLTAEELERLVQVIGLQELICTAVPTRQFVAQQSTVGELGWMQDFVLWANKIAERLAYLEEQQKMAEAALQATAGLEERLRHVESLLVSSEASLPPQSSTVDKTAAKSKEGAAAAAISVSAKAVTASTESAAKPNKVPSDRPLKKEEKDCIVAALTNLILTSKSRTAGSLISEMDRLLGGETLRGRKYNGYKTARLMLDRAVQEKLIRYGPRDPTKMPTIYFPNEAVPKKYTP